MLVDIQGAVFGHRPIMLGHMPGIAAAPATGTSEWGLFGSSRSQGGDARARPAAGGGSKRRRVLHGGAFPHVASG